MKYRRLGRTGLMVSEIGFGGEWLPGKTDEEAGLFFDKATAYGINILDCWMSDPEVRSLIGRSLRDRRDKWIIQGHIGPTWQNGQYVRTRDMSVVVPAFEDLLKRLETDYIDLGMIHYVDTDEDWDTIINGPFIEYVRDLKARGVIRYVGASSHNAKVAKRIIMSGEVDMLMFAINPSFDLMPTKHLDDLLASDHFVDKLAGIHPDRVELYKLCEQMDIGITVMKPFAAGRLFKAEASPFSVAMTPIQCLHYALTRPGVASVMTGFGEPAHIDEAVHYEEASEEEKDFTKVLASSEYQADTHKCMYCNHCLPCPKAIDIAMVNKFYDMAVMQAHVPDTVREHYRALTANASDCIACGGCEKRCPFGVPVVSRMKAARELFG
ncbi:MAG: aldo/keto reductase [Lachnospiraceae bacterium]|nr:aldo/keto reductase [Lachnospiraceae bacterium]